MKGAYPSLSFAVGVALMVHAIPLAGQAPPPPPPAPARAVMVVTQGAPAPGLPAPPAPIGIPPEELPSFEVASVKKVEGGTRSISLRVPGGGRITMVNMPLRTIVMQAFGIRDYQLIDAPGWMASDRFTINAKAEGNAPRDQLLLMVRSLLVERFQLRYRAEQREMQAYVLTTAEKEWKPTDRMKPAECGARGAAPPAGPIAPGQVRCGGITMSTNGLQARGVTLSMFVSLLGSIGGLGLIHDRTGLTGTYDIDLDASPTAMLRSVALATSSFSAASSENLLPEVGDGRSLSSAIRDLGLELERRREPVDVLVIESVSQPDED